MNLIDKILFEATEKDLSEHIGPQIGYGLIHEIGDASTKPYSFKEDNSVIYAPTYTFTTDKGLEYEVYFKRYPGKLKKNQKVSWELVFGYLSNESTDFLSSIHSNDKEQNLNTLSITNHGDLYRIMSTVIQIFKTFTTKYANNIESIYFTPEEKRGEVYLKFLQKNTNWKVKKYGKEYELLPPTKSSLKEIGDSSSKVYKYQFIQTSDVYIKAIFKTDSGLLYKVTLVSDKIEPSQNRDNWVCSFGIADKTGYGMDMDINTNRGELFKVMSTVISILKKFIQKYSKKIETISFKGTDERRDRLYQEFINKNLSSSFNVLKNTEGQFVLVNKNYKQVILQEVGEGSSKPYKFSTSYSEDNAIYTFKTDSGLNYKCVFEQEEDTMFSTIWEFGFGVITDKGIDIQNTYNKGEFYKVMSTITSIIKTFGNDYEEADRIIFKGINDKRDRVYNKFVLKNLPSNWSFKKDEFNNTILIKKFNSWEKKKG